MWGLPVFGEADCFSGDAEFLAELFYEGVGSLNLIFCGHCVCSVCYNADSYCLARAVPCLVRYDRPLPLPFGGCEDLPVICAGSVADEEMAVEVFFISQAEE